MTPLDEPNLFPRLSGDRPLISMGMGVLLSFPRQRGDTKAGMGNGALLSESLTLGVKAGVQLRLNV